MDVIEAMETCRAMRYLTAEPVPEDLIKRVIYAATRASSPGNSQAWEFIVITNPETKRRLGDALKAARAARPPAPTPEDPVERRTVAGATYLAEHFGDAPVIILVCGRNIYPPRQPVEQLVWSAVYPAAQNLIVAARSLGLGTTFTTFHGAIEGEIRETLGIPPEVYLGVTVLMGYPARSFGPVARRPIEEVLHWDRW